MGEPTGGLETRVAALEQVFRIIAEREAETERLAAATDNLASNVSGVERVLNSVDQAMKDAKDAKASAGKAQDTADESLAALARSEHRYRWRTRLMALLAVVISVGAALGIAWWTNDRFDRINQDQAVARYAQCEERNAQSAQQTVAIQSAFIYSIELFAAVKKTDPALARAIEAIPPAQRQPVPPPVKCPRP